MTPGLYDFNAQEYHADPCPEPSISRGSLFTLLTRSPLHAFYDHPKLGGKPRSAATDEMDFGDVAHQLILGKGHGFAIFEGETWRGGEATKFWDAAVAEKKTPIKRKDYARAESMARAVREQLDAFGLSHVFKGRTETTAVWKEGNEYARCMFDDLHIFENENRAEIWDLKTSSGSCHPDDLARKIPDLGYDMQEEWYTRGLRAVMQQLAGRIEFRFVFVETSFPYAITPYVQDGEGRAIGTSKVMRALKRWQQCRAEGKWPGYAQGVVQGITPEYLLKKELAA